MGEENTPPEGPVQLTIALESGGTKTVNIEKPAERKEGGDIQ